MNADHILLIGFGGPTRADEILPFLEMVARGRRIPKERLEEVAHHYEVIGGKSPYNEYAFKLKEALQKQLSDAGCRLPVYLGMRNWHPFLKDALTEIRGRGLRNGLAIILAPHRSENSFERYQNDVAAAVEASGTVPVAYEYIGGWFDHPLFIDAQAARVREALETLPETERQQIHLVFTAHSIPCQMPGVDQYVREFEASAKAVAGALKIPGWSLAYQSRSGPPQEPWLGPDISEAVKGLAGQGRKSLLLVPIGFIFDHAEVLFDLDVEARQTFAALGLRYRRAATVMDHPRFVALFREMVLKQMPAFFPPEKS